MIPVRSLRKNALRYFLIICIFILVGTLLWSDEENGPEIHRQSVKEKWHSRFKRIWNRKGLGMNKNEKNLDFPGLQKDMVKDAKIEPRSVPLDVFIFEEHHEALLYWFGAAYNGTIPKTGHTLIHIDGHSDMAQPAYFTSYPFFRWPAEDQLKFLLQGNDVFIQSAIMAGLVKRTIWIWPEWDRKNHEEDHDISATKLGWANVKNEETDREEITFCVCREDDTKMLCMIPKEREPDGDEISLIEPEKCHIKNQIQEEEIDEATALSLLKQRKLIRDSEHIILDIDEDFFGCSYVIKPLLDANVSMDFVELINKHVGNIVCPTTTIHETNANKIMSEIVSTLILQKSCKENQTNISKCKDAKLNAGTYLKMLLTNAHKKNDTKICLDEPENTKFQNFIIRFVKALSKLSAKQLQIVQEIGFCSTTTPKTFDRVPEFGLCFGLNTPLQTYITEFNPTPDSIKQRSVALRSILQNLERYSPKFVTLCRSVRDGYTPRRFFTTIENEILKSLKDVFKNINVHYDKDLLDGKDGRGKSVPNTYSQKT